MKFIFDLNHFNKNIGNACPCKILTFENVCPCEEFRNTGKCICGLFQPVIEEKIDGSK